MYIWFPHLLCLASLGIKIKLNRHKHQRNIEMSNHGLTSLQLAEFHFTFIYLAHIYHLNFPRQENYQPQSSPATFIY